MTEIIYKSESYAIIGACFEVYNEKGCGFLEAVYQECLGIEFEYQRIPAIAKPLLALSYRGRILKQTYEPDYVCFEKIIVELKAVSGLTDEHRAQRQYRKAGDAAVELRAKHDRQAADDQGLDPE